MKSIIKMQKFKSRKEWEGHIWDKLAEGFAEAKSAQEIKDFLNMLITVDEKKKMVYRAAAISFLKQGKSYREIGEALWLSPQTISAICKSLRAGGKYISCYTRGKKYEPKRKPLTKEELDQLKFSIWLGALFTLPSPPISHSRLNRELGISNRYFRKRDRG